MENLQTLENVAIEEKEEFDTSIKVFKRSWKHLKTGKSGSNYYAVVKHPTTGKLIKAEFTSTTQGVAGLKAMSELFEIDCNPVLKLNISAKRDKFNRVIGEYRSYMLIAREEICDKVINHELAVKPATSVDECNIKTIIEYMKIDPNILQLSVDKNTWL